MKSLIAKDIMNPQILAAHANWTISQLAEFLIENSISGAPVISEDFTLIGVVSLTDIVRFDTLPIKDAPHEYPHTFYLHSFERAYAPEDITEFRIETESNILVEDIMTPMIFHVKEETPLKEVAEIMVRGRIHRVFVTQDDKVTGVISALDMMKVILEI